MADIVNQLSTGTSSTQLNTITTTSNVDPYTNMKKIVGKGSCILLNMDSTQYLIAMTDSGYLKNKLQLVGSFTDKVLTIEVGAYAKDLDFSFERKTFTFSSTISDVLKSSCELNRDYPKYAELLREFESFCDVKTTIDHIPTPSFPQFDPPYTNPLMPPYQPFLTETGPTCNINGSVYKDIPPINIKLIAVFTNYAGFSEWWAAQSNHSISVNSAVFIVNAVYYNHQVKLNYDDYGNKVSHMLILTEESKWKALEAFQDPEKFIITNAIAKVTNTDNTVGVKNVERN